MRRRLAVLLLASLGVLGALAPSASGANPERANCLAFFLTGAEPGSVGGSASSNAQDPEAHPFGLNVISFTAHLRPPDCFG